MKSILYSILLFSLAVSYSVDFEDLPSFLNDDVVNEEITRPEFEDFMKRFGNDYGYNGTIDTIRESDMKRLRGAVYLDYTGAGLYRESQVTECNNLLLSNLYGNAHSRSPSSLNTEHAVCLVYGFECRWRTCERRFYSISVPLLRSTPLYLLVELRVLFILWERSSLGARIQSFIIWQRFGWNDRNDCIES